MRYAHIETNRGRRLCRNATGARRKQRGVVLLITLIVLVAMMLAGIGMMRSVDTTTMIAGNVAFREATLHAGDSGMNQAFATLLQVATTASDKVVLNYTNGESPSLPPAPGLPAVNLCPGTISPYLCTGSAINFPGYSATPLKACEVIPPGSPNVSGSAATAPCPNPSDYQWWQVPANWNGAPSITVKDAGGNNMATVYYLIHRMCICGDTGTSGTCPSGVTQTCQTIQENVNVSGSSMQVGTTKFTATSIYYRVTTKSVGPRNTVTYSQEMVLIPE